MSQVINISKSLIKKGDTLESLRLAYYSDRQRFLEAFANYGIIIDDGENDLNTLATLSLSGGDMAGALKIKGIPVFFSIYNIMKNVYIREDRYVNSGIELVD